MYMSCHSFTIKGTPLGEIDTPLILRLTGLVHIVIVVIIIITILLLFLFMLLYNFIAYIYIYQYGDICRLVTIILVYNDS